MQQPRGGKPGTVPWLVRVLAHWDCPWVFRAVSLRPSEQSFDSARGKNGSLPSYDHLLLKHTLGCLGTQDVGSGR